MNLIWKEPEVTCSKVSKGRSAFLRALSETFIDSGIIKTADSVCGNGKSAALGRGSEEISGVKCEDATTPRDSSITSITSLAQDVKEEKTF